MFDALDPAFTLPGPDIMARQALMDRAARVLRPAGALERLDRVAAWLAAWQRTDTPAVERPVVLLAAGDHGVVRRGVSAHDASVTRAMMDAFRAGVATSTVMSAALGSGMRIVDAGVGAPTGDITVEPALDPDRFAELVHLGRDTVAELDTDLLLLGEMGIGNTTAAAALAGSLFGGEPAGWVGPGGGADAAIMDRKRTAVAQAMARAGAAGPMEALRQVGGAEMAVLAGACLQARVRSIPVVLDGFVVTAAVAPLALARKGALDHCLAGHLSPEPGHRRLLDRLGMEPFLDLGMRLGEGSGALAARPHNRLAPSLVADVATFEEWGLR